MIDSFDGGKFDLNSSLLLINFIKLNIHIYINILIYFSIFFYHNINIYVLIYTYLNITYINFILLGNVDVSVG